MKQLSRSKTTIALLINIGRKALQQFTENKQPRYLSIMNNSLDQSTINQDSIKKLIENGHKSMKTYLEEKQKT